MSDAASQQGVIKDGAAAEAEAQVSKSDAEKDQAAQDYSRVEKNGQLSMRVKVSSPFNDYYDGQAFSISAENDTGPFDVLPKHHNFISLLNACDLTVRNVNQNDLRIRISGGLMHVKADRVIVFLDI